MERAGSAATSRRSRDPLRWRGAASRSAEDPPRTPFFREEALVHLGQMQDKLFPVEEARVDITVWMSGAFQAGRPPFTVTRLPLLVCGQ